MLTIEDYQQMLTEQDEFIEWLVEQNKKLTEEVAQLSAVIKGK